MVIKKGEQIKDENYFEKDDNFYSPAEKSFYQDRILFPPLKKPGHISNFKFNIIKVMDLCT